MLKFIVVGDSNSGKTQLINRFMMDDFNEQSQTTISSDLFIKILEVEDSEVRLQLWDMQGQDRMTVGANKLLYKGTSGALIIADITDQISIENSRSWKQLVTENIMNQAIQLKSQQTKDSFGSGTDDDDVDVDDLPMILVLNKYDLVEELVNEGYQLEDYMKAEYIQQLAEDLGFIGAVFVSAKTGVGVNDAVESLAYHCLVHENDFETTTKHLAESPSVSHIYDKMFQIESMKQGLETLIERQTRHNSCENSIKLRYRNHQTKKIKEKQCKC